MSLGTRVFESYGPMVSGRSDPLVLGAKAVKP